MSLDFMRKYIHVAKAIKVCRLMQYFNCFNINYDSLNTHCLNCNYV